MVARLTRFKITRELRSRARVRVRRSVSSQVNCDTSANNANVDSSTPRVMPPHNDDHDYNDVDNDDNGDIVWHISKEIFEFIREFAIE